MSDYGRISPYYIYTMSCRQVMRIKKISIIGLLIDLIPNSPHYNIMRIVWQTVRRITNEILGVKGFKDLKTHFDRKSK